jgi:hypothetical protein
MRAATSAPGALNLRIVSTDTARPRQPKSISESDRHFLG